MSKLYFRSKALDTHRALPIYLSACLPELADSSSINRDVPEMPTGMEKEEECEKHCQMALVAQRSISSVYEYFSNQIIIPTPHFHVITNFDIDFKTIDTQNSYLRYNLFEELSPGSLPEYDLDSDDEYWIDRQEGFGVSYEHFELIFASLQGSSYHDTSLFHALLCKFRSKFSEKILSNIYEYWLHKVRKRILIFENQKIPSGIMDTPYSSFRKRNDRIITRRYRKHDEQNYEKMYQFKKTFEQLAKISENIHSREKLKYQLIHILKSTFSSRDYILDWNGDVVKSFYVDLSLGDFHTNTYFNSASSTFNTNRITELRRTKQFKDEELEACDSKSSGVKYLLNNSNLRCSKFPASLYTDSNISSTPNNAFSLNQDGRFSFVSNNISKYIPPQYPSLIEDRLKDRSMNVPYRRRTTLDLNVANFQISSKYSSQNPRQSMYHKQRVKSTVYSNKYIYPKISSSPKRSFQSIFCLY